MCYDVKLSKSISGYTDNCFLELPNFVLEGMALAVEDNITIEMCKCYCINARHRYGSECQSLQYYFDSSTCLINKENRPAECFSGCYHEGCRSANLIQFSGVLKYCELYSLHLTFYMFKQSSGNVSILRKHLKTSSAHRIYLFICGNNSEKCPTN
uniref:Apple domain-containing protein n=1 Tax=Parascaris equorum TaxID=6256 RepID=A0A914R1I4_PAREQ